MGGVAPFRDGSLRRARENRAGWERATNFAEAVSRSEAVGGPLRYSGHIRPIAGALPAYFQLCVELRYAKRLIQRRLSGLHRAAYAPGAVSVGRYSKERTAHGSRGSGIRC